MSPRAQVATHALAAGVHIGNVARDLGDAPATILATYCRTTDGPSVCNAMESILRGAK